MNKDASDFALEEFEKIAGAYFDLGHQINEWFRLYVALIGLPITAFAAFWRFGDTSWEELAQLIPVVLFIMSLLGMIVCAIVVSSRFEMILYARTLNGVRRYFIELDKKKREKPAILAHLVLPNSDGTPHFYEKGRPFFFQVGVIGFVNGSLIVLAGFLLGSIPEWVAFAVGIFVGSAHLIVYRSSAKKRNAQFGVKNVENMGPINN